MRPLAGSRLTAVEGIVPARAYTVSSRIGAGTSVDQKYGR